MRTLAKLSLSVLLLALLCLPWAGELAACTGITLKAKDGAVVRGRSMEWGTFDLRSRLVVIPRGQAFTGATPDGKPGLKWQARYGVAALDMLEKGAIADGLNEKGLSVGLFYHPGFASYAAYDPAQAGQTMGPADVAAYLLTQCATVAEAREALAKVRVVAVVEPALGFAPPAHFLVTDAAGQGLVVEFLGGQTALFDNPLGVITNAPGFDWHLTNLRNYINLSQVALPDKKIGELDFTPLGAGSGMIGLPGDSTPPSRFVRAVAFSQTARPTPDGPETIYEAFRIMDNFNLPLGAAEGAKGQVRSDGMRSSTIWTVAIDTKNLVIYYHTQHNRRVRMFDLKKLDFGSLRTPPAPLPLDRVKAQDIEEVTPR